MRRREASATSRVWLPAVAVSHVRDPDHHLLLWQVRGRTEVAIDAVVHVLDAGRALWLPVDVVHDLRIHEDAVMTPAFFEHATTATTLQRPTIVDVDDDLRTLLLAYTSSWDTLIRHPVDLGRQILARVERQPTSTSTLRMPARAPARIVAQALLANPGDPRGVDELARLAHASARTLERSFLGETGMTLRAWRLALRMERAAELLEADADVAAVALRVGYANLNAFRRAFQAHVGLSPTRYRKRRDAA